MFTEMLNNLDGYKPVAIALPGTLNFVAVKTPRDDYLGFRKVRARIEVYLRFRVRIIFRMILEKDPNISVKYPSK